MRTIRTKVKHYGFDSHQYLNHLQNSFTYEHLRKLAEESLDDFRKASPTMEISANWSYSIKINGGNYVLSFENSTFDNGENVAVVIDVGHGTLSGGWVQGKNYLKEPIKKTYERINKLLVEAP